jgi:predicted DNA-binding transcriptional regulator AlpA
MSPSCDFESPRTSTAVVQPVMMDARAVAEMLGVSVRHIWRLSELGKTPLPVRLGSCVRWPRASIEAWIAAGCPARSASPRKRR